MRLRHIKGSEEDIKKSSLYIEHNELKENNKIDSFSIFNNNNPLYIELGMGKGNFIINNSIANKNINYIGIEKYATVLMYAIKNYNLLIEKNDNIKIMCIDIKNILNYFKPHTVDKIFLNFSDPWPKKRHENRRLTSKDFLDIYKILLKPNATIELKTDNIMLFDYTISSLIDNNFNIIYKTYDLYNDLLAIKDNIPTEYEEKFQKKGNKIYKLIANT